MEEKDGRQEERRQNSLGLEKDAIGLDLHLKEYEKPYYCAYCISKIGKVPT